MGVPAELPVRPPVSLAHLTVGEASPIELIEAAVAGRFDAIGLRVRPPMPNDPIVPIVGDEPMIRKVMERLDATGIFVNQVEALWITSETTAADFEPALEVGARLGAKHVLVCGKEPDKACFETVFAQLCEKAKAFGLIAALEPISFTEIKSLPEALKTLAAVRQDNARILIDALHLARSGGRPRDIEGLDPNLFPFMHICDAPAKLEPADTDSLRQEARSGRLYPGLGGLPLSDFVATFPAVTIIEVEAPCAAYRSLPIVERGRLCGEATQAFLENHYPRAKS